MGGRRPVMHHLWWDVTTGINNLLQVDRCQLFRIRKLRPSLRGLTWHWLSRELYFAYPAYLSMMMWHYVIATSLISERGDVALAIAISLLCERGDVELIVAISLLRERHDVALLVAAFLLRERCRGIGRRNIFTSRERWIGISRCENY